MIERGMEDEVFSLNNLVVFLFIEMGKIEKKIGLWRKLRVLFRLC